MRSKILKGDVILTIDGKLVRVLHLQSPLGSKDLAVVQYIDKTEETYTPLSNFNLSISMGQSPEVLASFYASHSIHARLNRLKTI